MLNRLFKKKLNLEKKLNGIVVIISFVFIKHSLIIPLKEMYGN